MRAIWSGSLSFGLVNIPVSMYGASKENALRFRMLRKQDHCPIKYRRVCEATGEEVPYDDIVKGYEYEKGEFVTLSNEDFANADAKKTKSMAVVQFAEAREIDPQYFVKPYYLEPDKKAEAAYVLMREALRKSKKAGIVTFVIRNREHLGMLVPKGDALMVGELRYANEVQGIGGLHVPGKAKVAENEMKLALLLIDQLTKPFRIDDFRDTYTEALERRIQAKIRGKKPRKEGKAPVPTAVPDLMAALEESLTKSRV